MLRLRAKAYTEDVPRMHHPFDAVTTNPLYSLGEKLPHAVSYSSFDGGLSTE